MTFLICVRRLRKSNCTLPLFPGHKGEALSTQDTQAERWSCKLLGLYLLFPCVSSSGEFNSTEWKVDNINVVPVTSKIAFNSYASFPVLFRVYNIVWGCERWALFLLAVVWRRCSACLWRDERFSNAFLNSSVRMAYTRGFTMELAK